MVACRGGVRSAIVAGLALAVGVSAIGAGRADAGDGPPKGLLFLVGHPDNRAAEFGLARRGEGYPAFPRKYKDPVVYTAGESKPRDWPYIHPAILDRWAGARPYTFTIRFTSPRDDGRALFVVIGLAGGAPRQRSKVVVTVNQTALPVQVAPSGDPRVAFSPTAPGKPQTMVFPVPPACVKKGQNTVSIRLDEQSWIIYDYVALSTEGKPLPLSPSPQPDLLAEFRRGPMAGVAEIVFAVRKLGDDPHWYANFGYTLDHSRWRTYHDGARLCRLDLRSRKVVVLLDDPKGGVRDPAVHYDGKTILFAHRKGGSPHYHLHTIQADGSGLRQLTDGPFDDVEPTWLPDGGIMFCSTRSRRRVNCHTTESAILYRCDADGGGLRMVSSNIEPDNTPWPLPSGQVLYTRWEYVDRNQLTFHHLWVTNPDGVRQMVFFGNMHPGTAMLDAKPIPGSHRIVASFSPGHGRREHDGVLTVVDPRHGPDDRAAARPVSWSAQYRDPWAFSEDAFMAASGTRIVLMDGSGLEQTLHQLPPADAKAGLQCHEPRPLVPRPREPLIPTSVDWRGDTGRLVLLDVRQGRNMAGVKAGEIKKLLVLEALPKPFNYTGGMEPMSYGGTFTLERILGTVPVEPDGSAYAEVPALRSLFFVALDENEMSVKRMQSFLTVMPGETTSCVGCHEPRSATPQTQAPDCQALRRPPSTIQPIPGVPDVFDYPRDIQPILDKHCLECHDYGKRKGGVILSGDRGPIFSISYYTMTARTLVVDGRNGMGNRPPRSIGSSASRLMKLVDGSHYGAKLSEHERRMLRLWIDSGAAYPGTYAALGTGMVGGYEIIDRRIRLDRSDTQWPSVKAAMEALRRRCLACHKGSTAVPLSPSHDVGRPPWIALAPNDIRRRFSRHLLYNLTRPAASLILLAPLARRAGGCEACGKAIFPDAADPDYRKVLLAIRDAGRKLDEIRRFDMPGFRPRGEYVHEMQRFGILPPDAGPVDVYATDRAYWKSLWHR